MDELQRFKDMTPEEANAYLEEFESCTHDCSTCSGSCSSHKVNKPAKRLIAVMSGKGGTGKSVVTVLLANALKKQGIKVGILDADVACAAVPHLLGMKDPVIGDYAELAPAPSPEGIPVISMALISEKPEEPIIYPGLDLAKLAVYFLQEANWGDGLDVLLIDMPSGAGDIPLEYYATMPMDYSLCVATPGELASVSVLRAINLAEMLMVPVMGIVENFADPDFALSEKYGDIPVVASVGYDPGLRKAADMGQLGTFETDAFDYLAKAVGDLL